MSEPDFRDVALELLADSECGLRDRCASLEADCDSYRALALAAIAAVADLTSDREGLRMQLRAVRDEYRALREYFLRQAAA